MKELLLRSLAIGLLAVNVNCYADTIRITAINESPTSADLTIGTGNQSFTVTPGSVKMFTADYTYPATISIHRLGRFSQNCSWSMPLVGKQTIRALTLNISSDKLSNTPTCLIDRT